MSDSLPPVLEQSIDKETWSEASLTDLAKSHDISTLIENVMDRMQSKFTEVHEGLLSRVQAMDIRLDLLEKHLSDLIDYVSGLDDSKKRTNVVPEVSTVHEKEC